MKDRKQYDTAKPTTWTLKDSAGPVRLDTATSVQIFMFNSCSGVMKINGEALTILNQSRFRGQVKKTWLLADVDTVGEYGIEFLVTWADGSTSRFPTKPLPYETLNIVPTRTPSV